MFNIEPGIARQKATLPGPIDDQPSHTSVNASRPRPSPSVLVCLFNELNLSTGPMSTDGALGISAFLSGIDTYGTRRNTFVALDLTVIARYTGSRGDRSHVYCHAER
jgi:hypothetical protein